jgi:two-component system chemotaxis response regulator CheB
MMMRKKMTGLGMSDRLIKTIVVDDSASIRRMVSGWIESGSRLELVGSASNGIEAIHQCRIYDPDVVVLDVEMPGMSGLEALGHIVREDRTRVVLMFSALTREGIGATIEALGAGAADYITKPSSLGGGRAGLEETQRELLEKAVALGERRQRARELKRSEGGSYRPPANIPRARPIGSPTVPISELTQGPTVKPETPPAAKVEPSVIRIGPVGQLSSAERSNTASSPMRSRPKSVGASGGIEAVVIGSSTGGPAALTEIVPMLPENLPVPVLLVQHMPALFAQMLAERLDARSQLKVKIAEDGETVHPSVVYVSPGGVHLQVQRRVSGEVCCSLVDLPPEHSCKPAADVLFRSAAEVWGPRLLGTVLTGMGTDGTAGAERIVGAGGRVIVQDEASSVVWGMPGSIVQAGVADGIYSLDSIATEIVDRVVHRASQRVGEQMSARRRVPMGLGT